MMLLWLVVIVAVVWALWMAATRGFGGRNGGGAAARDPAEEVLRERFARGEIDEPTYSRMLAGLRRGSPP